MCFTFIYLCSPINGHQKGCCSIGQSWLYFKNPLEVDLVCDWTLIVTLKQANEIAAV